MMKLKETNCFTSTIPKFVSKWGWRHSCRYGYSIPPHNLGEIIDGTLALIENKDIKIKELMKHIPGPDFPTGGVIIGKDVIKQGYNKGRGSFKIRGDINNETQKMERPTCY